MKNYVKSQSLCFIKKIKEYLLGYLNMETKKVLSFKRQGIELQV